LLRLFIIIVDLINMEGRITKGKGVAMRKWTITIHEGWVEFRGSNRPGGPRVGGEDLSFSQPILDKDFRDVIFGFQLAVERVMGDEVEILDERDA